MNKLICIFSLTLVASLTLCAQPVKATRAEAVKDPVIKAMLAGHARHANVPISFHAPCTLQHGLGMKGRVEALLGELGFTLTGVADSHLCCGSAGTYSILQPALSQRLLANKIKALTAGKPAAIVTANIGCQSHLQSATALPVKHWIELLDARLA